MKTAVLFLAQGFEEIEAIATTDVLRRAGVKVVTVAIGDDVNVVGAHDVVVQADALLSEVSLSDADALILPGGWPGAKNLSECKPLVDAIVKQHAEGEWVAAICAAPFVLGVNGILKGKEATCYPGFEKDLQGATFVEKGVVVSGNVITARGPAFSIDFGLAIAEVLVGKENAEDVAKGMLYV